MIALLTAAIVAAAAPPSPSVAQVQMQRAIDSALQATTLAGAHVGVLAVDRSTGQVLYARNADDDFVPASTFKLLAGSVALATLGPAFTFVTEVDAGGPVRDGTLEGDLYLRGGGDAQLSHDDLNAAAAAVSAAGIARISGAIDGDASHFNAPRLPPGWAVDDLPYEFAAVPNALSLDLNVASVRVRPGNATGESAQLDDAYPTEAYQLENATTTGAPKSDDTTDLARPWNAPTTIRITGSYPLGAPVSDDLEPAVPDPAAYAIDAFQQALAQHGVESAQPPRTGVTPAGATVVWTHRSKPLAGILADFWLPSRNIFGEQLLEELGAQSPSALGAQATDVRARGVAVERAWLRGIGVNPDRLTIVDGSGLSAYDRITPRALVAILNADWNGPQRETVLAALPVAGVRGTLQNQFKGTPLQGVLYAKTGTENHARLLAGYLQTREQGPVIFALMINDWMDDSPAASSALEAARAAILTPLLGFAKAAHPGAPAERSGRV